MVERAKEIGLKLKKRISLLINLRRDLIKFPKYKKGGK